jgi:hypothetical protein
VGRWRPRSAKLPRKGRPVPRVEQGPPRTGPQALYRSGRGARPPSRPPPHRRRPCSISNCRDSKINSYRDSNKPLHPASSSEARLSSQTPVRGVGVTPAEVSPHACRCTCANAYNRDGALAHMLLNVSDWPEEWMAPRAFPVETPRSMSISGARGRRRGSCHARLASLGLRSRLLALHKVSLDTTHGLAWTLLTRHRVIPWTVLTQLIGILITPK